MKEKIINISGDKECDSYFNAVYGSERSRHTYQRRLNTISSIAGGLLNKQVLDVGCGYGFRTIGLAGLSSFVTGVDVDSSRIEKANKISGNNSIKNIVFKTMDARVLDFPDESFDVVVADEMIHHTENVSCVFSETYRVLKKQGIMIVSDHNKWSLPSQLLRWIYFRKERARLFSVKEIMEALQKEGFQDFYYKHILFTLPFKNIKDGPILRLNYLIEKLIESMPCIRQQCAVFVVRGVK